MKKLVIGMMVVCSLMATSVVAWCGDNGNGTVTVNGQVWLKDAGCLGYMNWDSAKSRVTSLAHGQCDLSDNSKPGDWRLPTIDELKSIYNSKSRFKDIKGYYYWSSSTRDSYTNDVWYVVMTNGHVDFTSKSSVGFVWPVRDGQ